MSRYLIVFLCAWNFLMSQTDTTWVVKRGSVYYDSTRIQIDSAQMYYGRIEGRAITVQYLKGGGGRRVIYDGYYVYGKPVELHCYSYSPSGSCSEKYVKTLSDYKTQEVYLIDGRKLWTRTYNSNRPRWRRSVYYDMAGRRSGCGAERSRPISRGCDAGDPYYHKTGFWIYYLKGIPVLPWFYAGLFYHRI